MKQTAMMELLNQLREERSKLPLPAEWDRCYQAIEMMIVSTYIPMEKEQIIKSNRDGVDMVIDKKDFINGEDYYNDTFNKNHIVDTNKMVNFKEVEIHELEVLRNKIKREIGEREPQSKYGSGYKQALIDVEGMIMDMLVVPCFPQQNDVREDDVEKLAKERYPEYYSIGLGGDRIGFERGYQLAKENTYTEEQIRELVSKIRTELAKNNHNHYSIDYEQIIQSLKQPKQ